MHKKLGLAIAHLFAVATVAQAGSVIVVGDHMLLPNTPNQQILIFITSDAANIQGMNFTAVLGDGGSALGGVDDAVPVMTADILTGTIWAAHATNAVNQNPDGAFGVGLAVWAITTTSGFLPVPGVNALLATLTIDNTGFACQGFTLNLDSPNAGTTDFAGISISITNGSLVECPEPTSAVLVLFGAAGFGAIAIRRRAVNRGAL